jgi:hypothetical protein
MGFNLSAGKLLMAIRKSIWFYNSAVPTLSASLTSSASNTSSTTLVLDYLNHTNTNIASANSYRYVDMTSVTDYVIQTGDFLEYDIYWESNLARIAVDLVASDGSTLRDSTLAKDQNAVNSHPNTDLTAYAYQKWYHRKIPITTLSSGNGIGKTISNYFIAGESDVAGALTARIKNICITDGKGNNVYNTQNFAVMF